MKALVKATDAVGLMRPKSCGRVGAAVTAMVILQEGAPREKAELLLRGRHVPAAGNAPPRLTGSFQSPAIAPWPPHSSSRAARLAETPPPQQPCRPASVGCCRERPT